MHSIALSFVLSAVAVARGALIPRQDPLPGNGTVQDITLDIVNAQGAPDGFERSLVTANGTFPGPLITAKKGDTLRFTVNNQLTDPTMRRSTSLDYDGLFFSTANAHEEGTPFVTTCPLGPNTSFVQEVPLAEQAGTFWYHSQLSVQYSDGLRGPLIVYDDEDPQKELYDIDDETTIITLADHWHNSSIPLLEHYVETGVVPVSDTGLVNGKGRFNGGPEVPFAVVPAQPGKRHRLRIINMSMRNVFTFSIDNHTLTIIEADGVATQPLVVDEIQILAGQRYSVVLEANQTVGNFWINAPHVGGNPAVNPNQNASLAKAILRYEGAPDEEPAGPLVDTTGTGQIPFVEADLLPLVPQVPPEPDITMTFDLVVTTGKAIWNVNNVSYLPPETPTLVKILSGASNRSDFNVTENTFTLPANQTVEIVFPATDDDDAHPFHLHGNNFWLIKSMTANNTQAVPIKRDVAGVGASGTTVRFTTDNAGPWFFHCHIFWHMQAGLATVMAMDPDGIRAGDHPDSDWEGLCPAYDALPEDQK